MQQHIYQKIDGWFNFSFLYNKAVEKYDNAKFVEIGCWKGRSAAYMAVEIINSNKSIEFYCVDSWKGDKTGCLKNVDVYEEFIKNIQPVADNIIIIRELSEEAAKRFEDNELDFVFIDASHDYKSVSGDLRSWFPKLKKGGIISGHDYHKIESVKKAVDDWADEQGLKIDSTHENVWFVEL